MPLPQLEMSAAEFGSTDAVEMSVFHGLEEGKICRPFRSGVPLPLAVNVTDAPPAVAVAFEMKNVGLTRKDTCAWPEELVVVLVALTEPSVADHVTVTPDARVPLDLRTVTTSGLATRAPYVATCLSPLALEMESVDVLVDDVPLAFHSWLGPFWHGYRMMEEPLVVAACRTLMHLPLMPTISPELLSAQCCAVVLRHG